MENQKRTMAELENVRQGKEFGRARGCQDSKQLGKTAWSKARKEDNGKLEKCLAGTARNTMRRAESLAIRSQSGFLFVKENMYM